MATSADSSPTAGATGRPSASCERAIDKLPERRQAPSHHSGYTGVAWTVAHLERFLLDPAGEHSNKSIDVALEQELSRAAWDGPYCLIDRLVGFGCTATAIGCG